MSIVTQLFRRPILSRPRTLLSVENDLLILSDTLHRLSNAYSNLLYLGNTDAAEDLYNLQQNLVDITAQLQDTIEYYQTVSHYLQPGPGENADRLGIKTDDPLYTLDIRGDVGVLGPLYVSDTLLLDQGRNLSNVASLRIDSVLVLDGTRNISNIRNLDTETLTAETGILVDLISTRVTANTVISDITETKNLNVAYVTHTQDLISNTATIANLLSEQIAVSNLTSSTLLSANSLVAQDLWVNNRANIETLSANTLTVNVIAVKELQLTGTANMVQLTANSITSTGNVSVDGNLLVQRYLLQPDGSQKRITYYFGIDENETLTLVKATEDHQHTVATFFDQDVLQL